MQMGLNFNSEIKKCGRQTWEKKALLLLYGGSLFVPSFLGCQRNNGMRWPSSAVIPPCTSPSVTPKPLKLRRASQPACSDGAQALHPASGARIDPCTHRWRTIYPCMLHATHALVLPVPAPADIISQRSCLQVIWSPKHFFSVLCGTGGTSLAWRN